MQNMQPCSVTDGTEGKRYDVANPEACSSHGRDNEIRSAEHVAATKCQKTIGHEADNEDDARVVVAAQDTAAYVLQGVHNLIGAAQEHERGSKRQDIRVAVVERGYLVAETHGQGHADKGYDKAQKKSCVRSRARVHVFCCPQELACAYGRSHANG